MAGLDMTDEQRAAEVVALVRELQMYEARVSAGDDTQDWAARVEGVKQQLAARGYQAATPARKATTRGPGVAKQPQSTR